MIKKIIGSLFKLWIVLCFGSVGCFGFFFVKNFTQLFMYRVGIKTIGNIIEKGAVLAPSQLTSPPAEISEAK